MMLFNQFMSENQERLYALYLQTLGYLIDIPESDLNDAVRGLLNVYDARFLRNKEIPFDKIHKFNIELAKSFIPILAELRDDYAVKFCESRSYGGDGAGKGCAGEFRYSSISFYSEKALKAIEEIMRDIDE